MNTLAKKNRTIPSLITAFNDVFSNDLLDLNEKSFNSLRSSLPSANIHESDKSFDIELAVPGLKKEDFNIELKNNVLSISSELKEEKEVKNEEENYTRKEFNYESFCRSFSLPQNADANKIDASYKNGILSIEIGKRQLDTPNASKAIIVK